MNIYNISHRVTSEVISYYKRPISDKITQSYGIEHKYNFIIVDRLRIGMFSKLTK